MPSPEYAWIERPEVIKTAIYVLSSTVVLMGGALISVCVYMYKGMEGRIDRLTNSLESIADKLFTRTDSLEHRVTSVEAECRVRHQRG